MRCGARRCRSSMSYLPDAISANCGFLISAVAPGAFSISSSRPGRALKSSGSICPMLTSGTQGVILRRRPRTSFVIGKAEAIPLADASQDTVTSIFLFHELPPKVRRSALRECARVLKPGGRLILQDSLQRDDLPDYEGPLQLFPQSYHEPFYASYTKEDFAALASECGFVHVRSVMAFVSKVMVFDKAATPARGHTDPSERTLRPTDSD
jgi:SAM-dependent methyltransferase